MKHWFVLFLGVVEASIILGLVYSEPTRSVRGALRGEAFLRGRPTSYWRAEIEREELACRYFSVLMYGGSLKDHVPTRYERFRIWIGLDKPDAAVQKREDMIKMFATDDDAKPVLRELTDDPLPIIGLFAEFCLKR